MPAYGVGVFGLFGLKTGIHFAHFGLESGTVFEGTTAGADPGFSLGGGALVSCSTSTPINHVVFFLAEYQLY